MALSGSENSWTVSFPSVNLYDLLVGLYTCFQKRYIDATNLLDQGLLSCQCHLTKEVTLILQNRPIKD